MTPGGRPIMDRQPGVITGFMIVLEQEIIENYLRINTLIKRLHTGNQKHRWNTLLNKTIVIAAHKNILLRKRIWAQCLQFVILRYDPDALCKQRIH